jgi:hypothetical protein
MVGLPGERRSNSIQRIALPLKQLRRDRRREDLAHFYKGRISVRSKRNLDGCCHAKTSVVVS